MKKVLIGVGGSGQHVVHAYLRLLALSNIDASEVPSVYLIDADAKKQTAAAKDSSLAPDICYLHGLLIAPLAIEDRPDFELIRPYLERTPNENPGLAAQALSVNPDLLLANALLLDDAVAKSSDYEVQVGEGMMANARIGASVFGIKLDQAKDSLLVTNFGKLLEKSTNAHVAIVGSTFGGTGSGVVPALVRYLDRNGVGSLRAFMTLPWFAIDSSNAGEKSAASEQNGINPMTRNASLGLRTYIDELDNNLNRSNYVISQFLGPTANRKDDGNFNQAENPHVFNLMLSVSVQHFLHGDDVEGQLPPNKRKLFGLIVTDQEEHGVFDAITSPHLRLHVAKDDNRCLQDIILDAEAVALVLEKSAEYILSGATTGKHAVVGADPYPEPKGFGDLMCKMAQLQNTPLIKRGGLWGVGAKEAAPREIYLKLSESLIEVSKRIRHSLLWLDLHKKTDDQPSGVKISAEIKHLFNGQLISRGGHRELEMHIANEQMLQTRWSSYGLEVYNRSIKGSPQLLKASVISKACALFINCFYDTDFNWLDELTRQHHNQKGQSIYDLAAEIITSQIFKEVIKAREQSRQKAFKKDAQDSAKIQRPQTLMLKGLDQAQQLPETSRLCQIATTQLDPKNALKEEHPLSLRHIDPYLGVSSISQLLPKKGSNNAEHVFPETALKGIPNILAPMLLQRWRLACFTETTGNQKQEALDVNSHSDSPRSTTYGIYLHARRILEAAFWVLFTQNKSVKLTQKDISNTGSPFDLLVKRELKPHHLDLPNHFIQFAEGDKKGHNVFINDPETGWYLAANYSARAFMAQIMPELPSVKYGDSKLDAMWRGKVQAETKEPFKGTYEANMIHAFALYLTKIVEELKPNAGKIPLWYPALKELAAELTTKVKGLSDTTSPVQIMGTIELMQDGSPQSYRVVTPKAINALKGLFIEQPVYFYSRNDQASEEFRWQRVWPLKGEAWQYIDPYDNVQEELKAAKVHMVRNSDAGSESRSVWRWDDITLKIKGLGTTTISNPFAHLRFGVPGVFDETDEFSWSAGLWPNFQTTGWSHYIAGGDFNASAFLSDFDLSANALRGENFELVFYGDKKDENGREVFGEIGTVKSTVPIKLMGIPRSVELRLGGQILGSVPIILKKIDSGNAPCAVALDLGTSNTCMAVKRKEGKPISLAMLEGEVLSDDGKLLPDLTWSAGYLKAGRSGRYHHQILPSLFFQSFNQKTQGGNTDNQSIPSELLFVAGRNEQVKPKAYIKSELQKYKDFGVTTELTHLDHNHVPIVSPLWTPFPPNVDDNERQNLIRAASSHDQNYVDNFKWPLKDGEAFQRAFRAAYLENTLAACFATLKHMNTSHIESFTATYPGAFQASFLESYERDLKSVLGYLAPRCGIKIDPQKVNFRTETIAALSSCDRGVEDLSLTIDMGGGTTDIGLIVPTDAHDYHQFKSYMASLRYAGNDLLKSIIQVQDKTESESSRLLKMKVNIRQSKAGEMKLQAESAYVTRAFFDGLFEYVFTLVSAFSKEKDFPDVGDIKVYFFGNGFKLISVFLGQELESLFSEVKQEAVKCGLFTQSIADRLLPQAMNDGKLKMIKGVYSEAKDSPVAEQHKKIEDAGHGRVPLWLPCIFQPSKVEGEKGLAYERVTCGNLAERDLFDSANEAKKLRLDKSEDALKKSFPLTYKYWQKADREAIFNNVPFRFFPYLGKFYLEGGDDKQFSYVENVLYRLAQESENPYSQAKHYDT